MAFTKSTSLSAVGVPVPSELATKLIVGALTPASAGVPTSSKSAPDRVLSSIVSVKVTLNTTVSEFVTLSVALTPVSYNSATRSTEMTSGRSVSTAPVPLSPGTMP